MDEDKQLEGDAASEEAKADEAEEVLEDEEVVETETEEVLV